MKRIKIVLVFLLISLCFMGCQSQNNPSGMKINVKNGKTTYNGTETRTYTVESAGQLEISVDLQDGEISILVYPTSQSTQQYVYKGDKMSSGSFIVTLPEATEYTVLIKAKNFQGSYTIEYSNK